MKATDDPMAWTEVKGVPWPEFAMSLVIVCLALWLILRFAQTSQHVAVAALLGLPLGGLCGYLYSAYVAPTFAIPSSMDRAILMNAAMASAPGFLVMFAARGASDESNSGE